MREENAWRKFKIDLHLDRFGLHCIGFVVVLYHRQCDECWCRDSHLLTKKGEIFKSTMQTLCISREDMNMSTMTGRKLEIRIDPKYGLINVIVLCHMYDHRPCTNSHKRAVSTVLWPFLNGNKTIAQPPSKENGQQPLIVLCKRLLRNFTTSVGSVGWSEKRQRANRFPVYDKRNGHSTENGNGYINNKIELSEVFAHNIMREYSTAGAKEEWKTATFGEKEISCFLSFRTHPGNACAARPFLCCILLLYSQFEAKVTHHDHQPFSSSSNSRSDHSNAESRGFRWYCTHYWFVPQYRSVS